MSINATPRSTATIAGRPIHPMMVSLPITLFIVTFVCDVLFRFLREPLLALVSYYALAAGIVLAALAALFGFFDYLGSRQIRSLKAANIHMIGNISILVVSIFNYLLRYGEPDKVPTAGLVLSSIVFIGIHITGWMGWTMVYRHGVGVEALR